MIGPNFEPILPLKKSKLPVASMVINKFSQKKMIAPNFELIFSLKNSKLPVASNSNYLLHFSNFQLSSYP
jgi:hypothetical protein